MYHIHPLRKEDFDTVDVIPQLSNRQFSVFNQKRLKLIILYNNYTWFLGNSRFP